MATKKYGITDPDGSKTAAKVARESDKRVKERLKRHMPTKDVVEKNAVQAVGENIKNAVETTANVLGTAQNIGHSIGNSAKSIRQAVSGGSPLVIQGSNEAFTEASKLAQGYGIADVNPKELLGTDPYKADGNIPQMSASEANKEKLVIQRQNNSLDVRYEKIKQGTKVIQVATEQRKLIGDVVGFHTAGIEVASKMVDNQIADTKFRTKQSKLEETEELLIHQQIATQGAIDLTEGKRLEIRLKVEAQQTSNENLRLMVEGSRRDNLLKAEEIEAKILG